EPEQRLELERRRLWTRLALLIIPAVMLTVFGAAVLEPAAICLACALGSYGLVWALLRWRPSVVRDGQLSLRLLAVFRLAMALFQVHVVMLQQANRFADALDLLFVLPVVAGVASNGFRGGLVMTLASVLAMVADRWLLVRQGVLSIDLSHPGM